MSIYFYYHRILIFCTLLLISSQVSQKLNFALQYSIYNNNIYIYIMVRFYVSFISSKNYYKNLKTYCLLVNYFSIYLVYVKLVN